MKRSISAAAGFVINGGAIIPREATPYWRGRSRYVSQFLMGLGCPILYTVHGNGVCEIGASTRMSDDFIVLMLSTDAIARARTRSFRSSPRRIQGGASRIQSRPAVLLSRGSAGMDARRHVDRSARPKPGADLSALVRLRDDTQAPCLGYELIECPREEIEPLPSQRHNNRTAASDHERVAVRSRAARNGMASRSLPIDYDEVHKYGGGIRCNTMQLIRDHGPGTFTE